MTKELIERAHRRHTFADVPLLMLTATFGGSGSGRLALAMLVGVAIAGVGGLTAALVHNGKFPPSRD